MPNAGPVSELGRQRSVEIKNVDSIEIPAFAVVEIVETTYPEPGRTLLSVRRPTVSGQPNIAFNLASPIAAGKNGAGTAHFPLYGIYTGDQPAAGQAWGAKAGSFYLHKDYPGVIIIGGVRDGRVRCAFGAIDPSAVIQADGQISALSGSTAGTGTGIVQKIIDGALTDTLYSTTVCNIGSRALGDGRYALASRDYFGSWNIEQESAADDESGSDSDGDDGSDSDAEDGGGPESYAPSHYTGGPGGACIPEGGLLVPPGETVVLSLGASSANDDLAGDECSPAGQPIHELCAGDSSESDSSGGSEGECSCKELTLDVDGACEMYYRVTLRIVSKGADGADVQDGELIGVIETSEGGGEFAPPEEANPVYAPMAPNIRGTASTDSIVKIAPGAKLRATVTNTNTTATGVITDYSLTVQPICRVCGDSSTSGSDSGSGDDGGPVLTECCPEDEIPGTLVAEMVLFDVFTPPCPDAAATGQIDTLTHEFRDGEHWWVDAFYECANGQVLRLNIRCDASEGIFYGELSRWNGASWDIDSTSSGAFTCGPFTCDIYFPATDPCGCGTTTIRFLIAEPA